MKSNIVPIGADAIPMIQDLAYRIWPDTFGEILSKEQIDYMLDMMYGTKSLNHQMSKEGLQFFLCLAEEQAVGFMSVERIQLTVRIHKLYILPEKQGCGLGTALLAHAKEWALEQNVRKLILNVNKYNTGAIAFYKQLGFQIHLEEDIDIGNGYWMNDYQMTLAL